MPIWIVRAIWQEDEGEATKEEAIEAESPDEAIRRFLPQLRFPPHHVEARLRRDR